MAVQGRSLKEQTLVPTLSQCAGLQVSLKERKCLCVRRHDGEEGEEGEEVGDKKSRGE